MSLHIHTKFIIITFLLLSSALSLSAQNVKKPFIVELKGILVSSSDGEKLVGAYVYTGTDMNKPVAATDSLGAFTVKCYADSVINLSFSYIGFLNLTKKYLPKNDMNIGTIKLAPDILNIDEIVVTAHVPLATQKGDTTEFNAAALKLSEDADLEKLLKKLPGFEIVDGKIMAQGEEVKKLYVDGKTYFLNNPAEALKNLPASLVAKVKMYDDKSEEAKFSGYDDGSKYRSLNIVTKNPNQMKIFGNTNGEYGISKQLKNTFSDNKYDVGLSANLFDMKRRITIRGNIGSSDQANTLEQAKYKGKGGKNGNKGLTLNYSSDISEKIMVTGNYHLSSDESYSANSSLQDYFPSDTYESRIYDSESHSWGDNQRHALNMQIDYKISKKDKITFSPSLSFSNGDSRSVNLASTVENSDTLNNSLTKNFNNNDNFSLDGKLSWMHAFAKRGRTLTTSINFRNNVADNVQNQNMEERFLNKENILTDTLRNKKTTNKSNDYNISASVSYSEPLSKSSRMSANYSFDKSSDNNEKESLAFLDNEFKNLIGLDTTLTNGLGVIRINHRFGTNYNYNSEKIRFSAGGNISMTQMSNEYLFLGVRDSIVSSNYYDLSPRAEFNYKLGKNKSLNTSYNGSTSSPNAKQLQDILDVSNPLQVSKGNPSLKKSFNHSLSLRYNTSNSEKLTFMSASMSIGQSFNNVATNMRFISQDTIVNGYELQKGTRLSSPVNLNGNWSFNSNMNYSFNLTKIKMMMNTSGGYNYNHSPSIYDNVSTFSDSHRGNIGIGVSSNISENFDFNINSNSSYSYTKNTQTGKSELFNESVNVNLSWVFWKGFLVGGNFSYSYYLNKKSESVNQSNSILDLEIGKKLGKRKQFQLRFKATDILRQRNAINYSLTDHYAQTSYRTNTDNYYSLSLSYRFMRAGSGAESKGQMGGGMHRRGSGVMNVMNTMNNEMNTRDNNMNNRGGGRINSRR